MKAKKLINFICAFAIIREAVTLFFLKIQDDLGDQQERLNYSYEKPDLKAPYTLSFILLVAALMMLLKDKKVGVALFAIAFVIELIYQIATQFYEFFPFITTPIIAICLVIIMVKNLTEKQKEFLKGELMEKEK